MYEGISLRSAPPFGVVCAFFINASVYLIIAGILFACVNFTQSFYSPQLIALTHCFGIGFFMLMMFGALSQMLPVLAGIRLKAPKFTTFLTLSCVNVGLIAFLWAFLASEQSAFWLAMIMLGFGVGGFALFVLVQMLQIKHFTPTIIYMIIALLALLCGLICAELLLSSYVGLFSAPKHLVLMLCHLSLMIFAWIMLLIVGVILQVLPMFYVASSIDKKYFKIFLPLIYVVLLAFLGILFFTELEFTFFLPIIFAIIAFLTSFYAIKTLLSRRRKSIDTTMFLWFFAFYSLAFSGFFFIVSSLNDIFIGLGAIFIFFGFVCGVIFAMFYKIIPFLAWFHLSYAGVFALPNMRNIIPQRLAKFQISVFLLAFILCFVQFLCPYFAPALNTQILSFLCGLCFALCGFALIIATLKAFIIYHLGLKRQKSLQKPKLSS